MKLIRIPLFVLAGLAALPVARGADVYKIDPSHTTVSFTIGHMMISEVGGRFNDIAGEVSLDNGAVTGAKATIQAKSVDTANEARDKHLRNPDFFNVEKFPTITFEGTKIEKDGDKTVIVGKFTMHGVTKDVRLPFTLKGPIKDMYQKDRLAVSTETTLNRIDYGVGTSGPGISDEVKIKISAEAVKD